MSGRVASSQANKRSCRFRSELMFQEAIFTCTVAAAYDGRRELNTSRRSSSAATIAVLPQASAQLPPHPEVDWTVWYGSTQRLEDHRAREGFFSAKSFL